MKKITLKISTFLLLTMFALQLQAQITDQGRYTLKNKGTNKYLSAVDASTDTYVPVDAATGGLQAFTFHTVDHTNGQGVTTTGLWMIDTDVRGIMRISGAAAVIHTTRQPGAVTITSDGDKKASLTSLGGNEYTIKISGKLLEDKQDGTYLGGSTTVTDFNTWIIETTTLSTQAFDKSSIFISNPVNNEISIKGLTSNVSKVSVFTLLGSEVLTKNVAGKSAISVNVSGLAAGMYIVKLQGDNGSFSKKIIKQ